MIGLAGVAVSPVPALMEVTVPEPPEDAHTQSVSPPSRFRISFAAQSLTATVRVSPVPEVVIPAPPVRVLKTLEVEPGYALTCQRSPTLPSCHVPAGEANVKVTP